MEFPEGIDPSGSYMTFTVGTTGQDRDDFDAADFKTGTNGVNRYRFTCHVNALQMADTVTATLYYTVDGQKFAVNKEYSVKKYISYFEPYFNGEATSPYDDATLKMVKSVADYGHYAQPFLFTFHNVPSGTYALMPGYTDSYDLDVIREAVSGYGIERSIENTDIESVSFALSMESETSIILRLTMKSGAAAPTLTVNGTTLNPGDAGVKLGNQEYVLNAYGTTSEGKARYEIRIKNIAAHRLSDVFTVNGDANGAFEIKAVVFERHRCAELRSGTLYILRSRKGLHRSRTLRKEIPMERKEYRNLELELIALQEEDVIVDSTPDTPEIPID